MNYIILFSIISTLTIGIGNCFTIYSNVSHSKAKIIGGSNISIKKVPYHAHLALDGNVICGAVLISYQHVLTAAHCIVFNTHASGLKSPKGIQQKFSVLAGTDTTVYVPGMSSESSEISVKSIQIHPQYSREIPYPYDIAILKLKDSFKNVMSIVPIPLPSRDIAQGETLRITGLNTVGPASNDIELHLKMYETTVVDCHLYNKYLFETKQPSVYCHMSLEGDRTESGDSGSPMVRVDKIKNTVELAGIHTSKLHRSLGGTNVYRTLPFIHKYLNLKTW